MISPTLFLCFVAATSVYTSGVTNIEEPTQETNLTNYDKVETSSVEPPHASNSDKINVIKLVAPGGKISAASHKDRDRYDNGRNQQRGNGDRHHDGYRHGERDGDRRGNNRQRFSSTSSSTTESYDDYYAIVTYPSYSFYRRTSTTKAPSYYYRTTYYPKTTTTTYSNYPSY